MRTKVKGRLIDLTDMLNSQDKWESRSKNFLTFIARRIFKDLKLCPRTYLNYIEKWLSIRFGADKSTAVKIATHRNNFYTEVTNDQMTAKTFQKFTESLGANKVTVTVKLEYDDGRAPTTSSITFSNRIVPEKSED